MKEYTERQHALKEHLRYKDAIDLMEDILSHSTTAWELLEEEPGLMDRAECYYEEDIDRVMKRWKENPI